MIRTSHQMTPTRRFNNFDFWAQSNPATTNRPFHRLQREQQVEQVGHVEETPKGRRVFIVDYDLPEVRLDPAFLSFLATQQKQ